MNVEIRNDINLYMTGPIKSSLGKRVVASLIRDVHTSEISITIAKESGEIEANCWVTDEAGRRFGMVIPQETLVALGNQIALAMERKG